MGKEKIKKGNSVDKYGEWKGFPCRDKAENGAVVVTSWPYVKAYVKYKYCNVFANK